MRRNGEEESGQEETREEGSSEEETREEEKKVASLLEFARKPPGSHQAGRLFLRDDEVRAQSLINLASEMIGEALMAAITSLDTGPSMLMTVAAVPPRSRRPTVMFAMFALCSARIVLT